MFHQTRRHDPVTARSDAAIGLLSRAIHAFGWRALGCLVLLGLAGCHHGDDFYDPPMPDLPPSPAVTAPVDPAALSAPRWNAVLVAGDTLLHADDDAVVELQQQLQDDGVPAERVRAFSADRLQYVGGVEGSGVRGDDDLARGARGADREDRTDDRALREAPRPGTIEPARPALVLRALLGLQGQRGGGQRGGTCLAYLASKSDGETIELLGGDLSPDQLDRALSAGCGAAPTVVIVSGCNTGNFAAAPMTRANRIILTASSPGGKGFGCGPNMALTTFDECLLGNLQDSITWVDAIERTRRCVAKREQLVGQPPVGPASSIGASVATLTTPSHKNTAEEAIFRQGVGRFNVDDGPYFPALKAHTKPEFLAYAHAVLPKAMALTLAGTVAWASASQGGTAEDVARIALQRCEFQSGGACIWYARDANLAAVSTGGVPAIHPPLLARSGALTTANTPFIRADQRPEIARYLALPQPKVLALGPDTESIGIGTGATPDIARQAALEKCSMNGKACIVFAEADHIVLGYP